MTYFTYIYVDPRNRQPFYVGKGKRKRARQHLQKAKAIREGRPVNDSGPRLDRIVELWENGVEPEIWLLGPFEKETDALRLEEKTVQFFGRVDLGTGPLLNRNNGGGGGTDTWTAEQRARRAEASSRSRWYHDPETKREIFSMSKPEGFLEGRLPGIFNGVFRPDVCGENNPAFGKTRNDLAARNRLPKRWMTNGEIDRQVLIERTGELLAQGWRFGRIGVTKSKEKAVCERCNTMFDKHSSKDRRYCSTKCFREKQKADTHNKCERCDSSFLRDPRRASRFCSRICYDESRRITSDPRPTGDGSLPILRPS